MSSTDGQKLITMPPFKSWLASNIPAVYDNTMSYYEELCALIAYLEKQVTPAVNDNTAGLDQLKKYVENYFDNLDLQEEVNNKLDEMAESGELVEIINAYLQTNVATITDGYTLTTIGQIGHNTQTGAYYVITDTVDHTHVQHEVETGKYATVIDGKYLLQGDKKVAPMSAGLQSRLAACAATYINNRSDFVYGGTYSAFRPTVTPIGSKWEINCSTFAMLMAYGIDYDHSAYKLGTGNNTVDSRFCEDSEMLEWFSTPNEGATGDYRWKYTYDLAAYMYERGQCFEPNDDLSNVQTGDILFFKDQIGSEGVSTFREIDHAAIFGWWVSDNSYVVFEVGNLPSAQLYLKSNIEENLVLVGRVATKATKEDFEIVSYQQDNVTNNQNQLTFVRCKEFEPNEYYTLIAEITNDQAITDFYPVIYQNADRLYGYDAATKKPDGNIYIMPFLPTDLDAGGVVVNINARAAGMTQPNTTIKNPRVVKGLLTSKDVSAIPNRTCIAQNIQSAFTVDLKYITKNFAAFTITGALNSGNNYVCDIVGLHMYNEIMPCMGTTYTYTSGYSTTAIQYLVDFRLTTPRLVIKAPSAVTDGTFVKHTVLIPLLAS